MQVYLQSSSQVQRVIFRYIDGAVHPLLQVFNLQSSTQNRNSGCKSPNELDTIDHSSNCGITFIATGQSAFNHFASKLMKTGYYRSLDNIQHLKLIVRVYRQGIYNHPLAELEFKWQQKTDKLNHS